MLLFCKMCEDVLVGVSRWTYLELVEQLLNHLVCGHPAGDANFGGRSERRCENGGLEEKEG